MKPGSIKLIRVMILTSLLLVGCFLLLFAPFDTTDSVQKERIRTFGALRQCMLETQIFAVESGFSDTNAFVECVESRVLSTNKFANELRSVCDAVWINRDANDWIESVSCGYTKQELAMVGEYKVGGRQHFIGVSFSGRPIDQNAPPVLGFSKLKRDANGVRPSVLK